MIIGTEKAIKILTGIKEMCSSNKCWTCPFKGYCDEVLGIKVPPFDWEINLKEDTKKEVAVMSSNKMKELVSIFGKEIGEEFNIIDSDGVYLKNNPYHFTDDYMVDSDGFVRNYLIIELATGAYTIEKAPFVPKDGEEYWTYYIGGNDNPFNGRALCNKWIGNPIDKMNKLLGIVFRTEKEAKDYLPTWKKRLEGEELD